MDIIGFIYHLWASLLDLEAQIQLGGVIELAIKFMPFAFLIELPMYIIIMMGIVRWYLHQDRYPPRDNVYYPKVSCAIPSYGEGRDVQKPIYSITDQLYPGHIEIVVVIDGSVQNKATYDAAMETIGYVKSRPNRSLKILPKLKRGGKVSGHNTALYFCTGEVILSLDADSSYDNDMIANMVAHFSDPNVIGVAGNLRIRNSRKTILTRIQSIEYALGITASKIGLAEINCVQVLSGALCAFRKPFVDMLNGWDSGTGEDLDITLRMKLYLGRYPNFRINFEPYAIGHTDAPETLKVFFRQRLRWDADLYFLYVKKYRYALTPRLLGWRNFIILVWSGLLFQLVLPFIIILYTSYTFFVYPPIMAGGALAIIYFYYLILTTIFYLEYVLLVSERPREDLGVAWCLPFFPLLAFAGRIWTGVATLTVIFMSSHLDSAMAPWWVHRKTKF